MSTDAAPILVDVLHTLMRAQTLILDQQAVVIRQLTQLRREVLEIGGTLGRLEVLDEMERELMDGACNEATAGVNGAGATGTGTEIEERERPGDGGERNPDARELYGSR